MLEFEWWPIYFSLTIDLWLYNEDNSMHRYYNITILAYNIFSQNLVQICIKPPLKETSYLRPCLFWIILIFLFGINLIPFSNVLLFQSRLYNHDSILSFLPSLLSNLVFDLTKPHSPICIVCSILGLWDIFSKILIEHFNFDQGINVIFV